MIPSTRSQAQASGTAVPAASAQPSHAPVATRRRRTRKNASSAASSAGASRHRTSRRTLHVGRTLRSVTTPSGSPCQSGAHLGVVAAAARLVDHGDGPQGGAAERGEAGARQLRVRRGAELAAGLQEHTGQPRAIDLALLRHAPRQRAAGPLRGRADAARVLRGLAPRGELHGAQEPDRRLGAAVGPGDDPRLAGRRGGDVAEHEHAVDRATGPRRAPTRAPRRRRRSRPRSRRGRASGAGRGR